MCGVYILLLCNYYEIEFSNMGESGVCEKTWLSLQVVVSRIRIHDLPYTAISWDFDPRQKLKKTSQLFGGQFWIFLSFNSQGGCIKIELSKLFFKFWPKKLLNCVLRLKKQAKYWWNCKILAEMLGLHDFGLILLLSRGNLTTF